MITKSLDVVLSKPGIYVVLCGAGLAMVEVYEDGKCWQLTPEQKRDRELEPGGWVVPNILGFLGPFLRHPSCPL